MATSKLMEQCTNPNKYFEEYYLGLDFKYDPLVSLSLACGPEPGLSVLPWESGLSIDSWNREGLREHNMNEWVVQNQTSLLSSTFLSLPVSSEQPGHCLHGCISICLPLQVPTCPPGFPSFRLRSLPFTRRYWPEIIFHYFTQISLPLFLYLLKSYSR